MTLPIWAAEGGGKGGGRGARSLSCRRDGDISRVPVRTRGEPRDLHASLGAGQRDPGRVRDAPDPFLIPPVTKCGTESQSWALGPLRLYFPICKMGFGTRVLPGPRSYGRLGKNPARGKKPYRCPGLGPGAQNTLRAFWITADRHRPALQDLSMWGSVNFPRLLQPSTTNWGA